MLEHFLSGFHRTSGCVTYLHRKHMMPKPKIDTKAISQLITQTQSNFTTLVNSLSGDNLFTVITSTLLLVACLWLDVTHAVVPPNPLDGLATYEGEDGVKYVLMNVNFESDW